MVRKDREAIDAGGLQRRTGGSGPSLDRAELGLAGAQQRADQTVQDVKLLFPLKEGRQDPGMVPDMIQTLFAVGRAQAFKSGFDPAPPSHHRR